MKTRAAIALALTLLLAPCAFAQHQTFVVDPSASNVAITLNTTHEVVHGTFRLQSGSIDFDPSTPKMSGTIIVLAATGVTGNSSRDKRMHNYILQVAQNANISFEPKSYTGTIAASGDSTIQLTGIFTLLGTPHTITVPTLVHLDAAAAQGKAHFTIPYVQWGLKNPSFLFWKADNDVTIDLYLSGRLLK